jgi:hypothetical protein
MQSEEGPVRKLLKVMLVIAIASLNISPSYADSDPFPGVATGGEIPGTRISSSPGQSQAQWEATDAYKNRPECTSGSGNALEANATTHIYSIYCVKTWRPSADVDADATFRAAQDSAIAVATAESQAWNAANPGMQKCIQWGPIVHANGVSTASGGVCANPVAPGPGTTVPTESTEGVVGPTTAPTGSTSSTPAAIPTNDTAITGNGSPYTKILPGQLSTSDCPVGFQAANGIIVAIGTGTFTECWPELAWKANRLGGTYWDQFKLSGGTYDVSAVIDALEVIADYKVRAKTIAQAAADLTPGIQRCSTWTVYGQSGEECAYTGNAPGGSSTSNDSTTAATQSDSATVTITPQIDTLTARFLDTENLDSSTATVILVPVDVAIVPLPEAAQAESSTVTVESELSQDTEVSAITEITADLSARQLKNKIVLKVNANVEATTLRIVASKKGSKTIKISLTTNSDGDKTISAKLDLTGYTLTLKSGSQILDKFVLKK